MNRTDRFPFATAFRPFVLAVLVLFACIGAAAAVETPPPAASAEAAGAAVPGLVSHPPLHPVQRAMNKTNLSKLRVTVEVQWDADGRVSQARVLERTASGAVEKAVLKWARGLRFESGSPGRGLIPFHLRNDRTGGGNLPMTPPQMTRP